MHSWVMCRCETNGTDDAVKQIRFGTVTGAGKRGDAARSFFLKPLYQVGRQSNAPWRVS
jgi:hypothetical protein